MSARSGGFSDIGSALGTQSRWYDPSLIAPAQGKFGQNCDSGECEKKVQYTTHLVMSGHSIDPQNHFDKSQGPKHTYYDAPFSRSTVATR